MPTPPSITREAATGPTPTNVDGQAGRVASRTVLRNRLRAEPLRRAWLHGVDNGQRPVVLDRGAARGLSMTCPVGGASAAREARAALEIADEFPNDFGIVDAVDGSRRACAERHSLQPDCEAAG